MQLVVFEKNLNHENHPILYKELRSTLPEHRRLSDETKKQTIQMLSLGAKTRLVKNDLAEKKKKFVTNKDLQNLKASCKGDSENTLESFSARSMFFKKKKLISLKAFIFAMTT
ncbi:uncharacterized protein LOC123265161 [Cotesia glomerata]|uniref:uncharacterized protein LOC123265161 n=1 Tax=Cotesia glomerata TaxID=32391 RepID=UPI001D00A550|nr:uncharacterized protein LOC123265161 [Cotesia glomerata]